MSQKIYSLNNKRRSITLTEYNGIITPVDQICQAISNNLGLDYYRLQLNRIMSYEIRESASSDLIDFVRLNLAVGVFKAPIEKSLVHLLIDQRIADIEQAFELQSCYARALATLPLAFAVYKKNDIYIDVFAEHIAYDTKQPIHKEAFVDLFNRLANGFTELLLKAIDGNNPAEGRPYLNNTDSSMLTILGAMLDAMAEDYEFQCYLDPLSVNKANLKSMGAAMSTADIAYLTDSYSRKLEEIDISIVPPEDASELSDAEIEAYQFIRQLDPNPTTEMNVSLLGIIKAMYINNPKQALEYAEAYRILNGRKNPKPNKSNGDNMYSNKRNYNARRNPDDSGTGELLYIPQLIEYITKNEAAGLDVYPMAEEKTNRIDIVRVGDITEALGEGKTDFEGILSSIADVINSILSYEGADTDSIAKKIDLKSFIERVYPSLPEAEAISKYMAEGLASDVRNMLFNFLLSSINAGNQLVFNITQSLSTYSLTEKQVTDLLAAAGMNPFFSNKISDAITKALRTAKTYATTEKNTIKVVGDTILHASTVKIIMSQDISNTLNRRPFSLSECRSSFFSDKITEEQTKAFLKELSFKEAPAAKEEVLVIANNTIAAANQAIASNQASNQANTSRQASSQANSNRAIAGNTSKPSQADPKTNQGDERNDILATMLTMKFPSIEAISNTLRKTYGTVKGVLSDEFNKAAGLGYYTVSDLLDYFNVPSAIPSSLNPEQMKNLIMQAMFTTGSLDGIAESLKQSDIKLTRIIDTLQIELNKAISGSDATLSGILDELQRKWASKFDDSVVASLTASQLEAILNAAGFSRYVTLETINALQELNDEKIKDSLHKRAASSLKRAIIINESANEAVIRAVAASTEMSQSYYYMPKAIPTRVVLDSSFEGGSLTTKAIQTILRELNIIATADITAEMLLDAIAKGYRSPRELARYFDASLHVIKATAEKHDISLELSARSLVRQTAYDKFTEATAAAKTRAAKYKYDYLIQSFLIGSDLIDALLNVLLINDKVTRIIIRVLCMSGKPMTRDELKKATKQHLLDAQTKQPKDKQPEIKLFDFATRVKFYQLDLLATRGKGIAKDKNPILTYDKSNDTFSIQPLLKEKLVVMYIERSRVVDPNFNARYWTYLMRPKDTLAKLPEENKAQFEALFKAIPGLERELLITQTYPDYTIIPQEYKDIIKPRLDKEGKKIVKTRSYSYLSSVAFGKKSAPIKAIAGLLDASVNERDIKNLLNADFIQQFLVLSKAIQNAAETVYKQKNLIFHGISAGDIIFTIGMAKEISTKENKPMAIPEQKLLEALFFDNGKKKLVEDYSSASTYAIKPLILELIDIMTKLMVMTKVNFIQDAESDEVLRIAGAPTQPVPQSLRNPQYSLTRTVYTIKSIPAADQLKIIAMNAYNIAIEIEKRNTLGAIASPARLRKVLDILYRAQGLQSTSSFKGVQLQKIARLTSIRAEDIYVLLQMLIYDDAVETVYSTTTETKKPLTNAQLERKKVKRDIERALGKKLRAAVDQIHALNPVILGRPRTQEEEQVLADLNNLLDENESMLIEVFKLTSADRTKLKDTDSDKKELLYQIGQGKRADMIQLAIDTNEDTATAISMLTDMYELTADDESRIAAELSKKAAAKAEALKLVNELGNKRALTAAEEVKLNIALKTLEGYSSSVQYTVDETSMLHYRLTSKFFNKMSEAERKGRELAYLNHLRSIGEEDASVSEGLIAAYGLKYGQDPDLDTALTYVDPEVYVEDLIKGIRFDIMGGTVKSEGDLYTYLPELESEEVVGRIVDPVLVKSIMTILCLQEQTFLESLKPKDKGGFLPSSVKKELSIGQILSKHIKGSELFYDTEQSDELYDQIHELLSMMDFHNYVRSGLSVVDGKDASREYWISTVPSQQGKPTMYQQVKKFFDIDKKVKPFFDMLEPQGTFNLADYQDSKNKLHVAITAAYNGIMAESKITDTMDNLVKARKAIDSLTGDLESTSLQLLESIQRRIELGNSNIDTQEQALINTKQQLEQAVSTKSAEIEALELDLRHFANDPRYPIYPLMVNEIGDQDLQYHRDFWNQLTGFLLENPRYIYEVGVAAVNYIKDKKTIGIIGALSTKSMAKRIQSDKLGEKARIVRRLSLKARKPRAPRAKKAKAVELISTRVINASQKANGKLSPEVQAIVNEAFRGSTSEKK